MNREADSLATPAAAVSPWGRSVWSTVAAFGVYFCMYAFRKPFTAGAYEATVWGLQEKTVLVVAQVLGYMTSKFLGIRIIAELTPQRRALGILAVLVSAEASLVLFALVPSPWHVACLFLNGLPLGLFFGLVVGYLEGRRHTEALTAGLCASFVLADGVTKSLGAWVLDLGFGERWMPCVAGIAFAPPLLAFLWMLTRIAPPTPDDVDLRAARRPMTAADRRRLLSKYAVGIASLVAVYLLITVLRSMRADFGRELWVGLGLGAAPATFTKSEFCVMLGVLAVNGSSVLILDNRRAFFTSLAVSIAAVVLLAVSLFALGRGWLDGFPFMVLTGLGLYLPYVAMHTTLFERLIAMTRERGNLGFLMYVADAIGYLGYVAVLLGKDFLPQTNGILPTFVTMCWWGASGTLLALVVAWIYFAMRPSRPTTTSELANRAFD